MSINSVSGGFRFDDSSKQSGSSSRKSIENINKDVLSPRGGHRKIITIGAQQMTEIKLNTSSMFGNIYSNVSSSSSNTTGSSSTTSTMPFSRPEGLFWFVDNVNFQKYVSVITNTNIPAFEEI